MSAYISIEDQLTAAFNTAKNTKLQWKDLEVRSIVTPDFTYPPQYREKNTLVTLGNKLDVVNVSYDRVPIAEHLTVPEGIKLALPKSANGNTTQLLPYISKAVGIDFTATDFVEAEYVISTSLRNIALTVAPTSLRWVPGGVLTVSVAGMYKLRNGQCEHIPIALAWLTPDQFNADHVAAGQKGTSTSPLILTGGIDYTPIRNILRNVAVYDAYATSRLTSITGFHQQIAAAMASVDGYPWVVASSAVKYNLMDAWPVYNGPTAGARGFAVRTVNQELPERRSMVSLVNLDYDRVLIMRVNPLQCTGIQNNMVLLHYNEVA